MAPKNLDTYEMLQISAEWLDPQSPAHKAIVAIPELAPSLKRIDVVHKHLAANAQPLGDDTRATEISVQQGSLDLRHDDIIRGTVSLFNGLYLLLGPEKGADILVLSDIIVPDGLASTQKSYRAEAGQAAQLADRLTPEVRAKTSAIFIGPNPPAHTLTEFLDEWIGIGKQLGAHEDEKARLAPPNRSQATLLAARNKWIRTVNLFVALAEDLELDAAIHQIIFGPLLLAESKAEKRGHKPAPAPTNQPEPLTASPPAPTNHPEPLPKPPSE